MNASFLTSPTGLVLRGVAALIFGVATLVWPGISLWVLVLLWGAYALVDGTIALIAAIVEKGLPHRGWLAFWGVTGIGAGVLTFVWPSITAFALLIVIAVWAILTGSAMIAIAISERKQRNYAWLDGIAGALTVGLGVLLLANPTTGALAVTWAIGWYACLYAGISFALAWQVHRAKKDLQHDAVTVPQEHVAH